MATLDHLNLRRKADRLTLADALCAIAAEQGAEVERREHSDYWPRNVRLTFKIDDAEAHIDLDGDSAVTVPLISWCANGGAGRCFSHNFECAAGAFDGQGRPHHKATSIPRSLSELADNLTGGLGALRVGAAFRHYIHPWAAETAWIGAGSPAGDKAAWIEHYRATGEKLSESPAVIAARAAYEAAGGLANFAAANTAAQAAFAEAG